MITHSQWQSSDVNSGALIGALNRDTVPELWNQLKLWQPTQAELEISLAGVERVDSAGMVMLIHLLEHAKKQNCHIMLSFVPTQLSTLLALSNVDKYIAEHIKI
ncbi:NTP-binding protein [Vibrio ponticus]|uniref:NTP-binding protein n=1 Tax=Vibrio ponticus TaxID=265668 RepID=A0A3N3DV63_9VIBR|nr:lipid asymmetry maintenance protein MlaB [Vibrio ponticus]OLQ85267.1 NTP-binding protein [Vibrio ponticus]ROV58377.1 STAS domain-containing protein [Vibrio ponticus]ROV61799.1 STAS domain-containing protein [Vibrio ponticus]